MHIKLRHTEARLTEVGTFEGDRSVRRSFDRLVGFDNWRLLAFADGELAEALQSSGHGLRCCWLKHVTIMPFTGL